MVMDRKSFYATTLIFIITLIGVLFRSIEICRISVFVLLILCIIRGKQEKKLLNPFYLFAMVPFSLLIYVDISDYTVNLTVETWILAIINMAAFVIALDLTPKYNKKHKCIGAGVDNVLVKNTIFMLILGYISVVFERLLGIVIPMASIFNLFSVGAIVCAFKSKKKWLITTVFLITFITWITYVSKTSILAFCLAVLICYEKYYLKSQKQKRWFIVLAISALLIMLLSFSFANQDRGGGDIFSTLAYYQKYGNVEWDGNAALFMPYMYVTTPWTNLQYVVETQNIRTFGLWTLKPLLGYIQVDSYFANHYVMEAYSSFNTFTYISCCFKDFGYWGSILSSMFLGFFSKKIYSRYLISRSPLDVVCYVYLAQAVGEMFFSNHFYTQSYPFTIVILMGLYKMFFCRKCSIELEEA